jgi:hypothetical protein
MMINTKKLSLAVAILCVASTVAYSQVAPAPPPKISVPPRESHNNILGDEIKFGPIGGAKSKPQVQVLDKCRVKYSKAIVINAEWSKHFGRTGWWCTYKPKVT